MPDEYGNPTPDELMMFLALTGMQGEGSGKDYTEQTSELGERMAFGPFSGADWSRIVNLFADYNEGPILTPESYQSLADTFAAGTGLELQLPPPEEEDMPPMFGAEDYMTVAARLPEMFMAAEEQDLIDRGISAEQARADTEAKYGAGGVLIEDWFPPDERLRFLVENPPLMERYAEQALEQEREAQGPIATEVKDARELGMTTGWDDLEAVMAANRRPTKTRVDPKYLRRLPTASLGGKNGTTLLLEGEGVGRQRPVGADRVSSSDDDGVDIESLFSTSLIDIFRGGLEHVLKGRSRTPTEQRAARQRVENRRGSEGRGSRNFYEERRKRSGGRAPQAPALYRRD